MKTADLEIGRYHNAFDRFEEAFKKNQTRNRKSDLELHIEYLEEKRRETFNNYSGFQAY